MDTADLKIMTGAQKAAALLLSLGVERSSQVLQHLGEDEMERAMLAISRAKMVSIDDRRNALREVYSLSMSSGGAVSGGIEYTRELLSRTVGQHRGTKVMERISAKQQTSSFEMLNNADPIQVSELLGDEHPQTIALVLSHLDARFAANILAHMPRDLQVDVTLRLALMDSVSPQVIQMVERNLRHKLSGVINDAEFMSSGGVTFLSRMLNQMDRDVQKNIFDALENSNAVLVDEVRANMFTFDDLVKLDDRSIQRVLSDVNKQDLSLALKAAPDRLRQYIYKNLSERARETLQEDVELLGPQLAKNVYAAQRRVVDIVRALEEAEEILIGGGGDEYEIIP